MREEAEPGHSRDLDDRQRTEKFLERCREGGCCGVNRIHVPGCEKRKAHLDKRAAQQSRGWCAPSEVLYPDPDLKIMPDEHIITRRGLVRFPWFRVETAISMHKRWFRRTFWRVHVRYHDGERMMHHYMTFYNRSDAGNAEQIIKFTAQTVNEKYYGEKNAR